MKAKVKANPKALTPDSDRLRRGAAFALVCAGLILSSASFANENLEISDVWARESPPTVSNGAVYLIINERSGTGDRLVGVSTTVAAKAELHEHRMEHDGNSDNAAANGHDSHKQMSQTGGSHGMMKMRQVEAIEIPANETVALAPMGYHIMLFDLTAPLKDGERFELTLEFENSGPTVVAVDVRKPGS